MIVFNYVMLLILCSDIDKFKNIDFWLKILKYYRYGMIKDVY